jgi:hypothetical protein
MFRDQLYSRVKYRCAWNFGDAMEYIPWLGLVYMLAGFEAYQESSLVY